MLPAYCNMHCLAPLKKCYSAFRKFEIWKRTLKVWKISELIHLEISIYVTCNYHSRPKIFTNDKGNIHVSVRLAPLQL